MQRFITRKRKRKLYLRLCREADEILEKTGIKDICTRCSIEKPYNPDSIRLGCCNDCNYLDNNGCTTQSLACKLWLCRELNCIISNSKFRNKWLRIEKIAEENGWKNTATNYRKGIDDYPELNENDNKVSPPTTKIKLKDRSAVQLYLFFK